MALFFIIPNKIPDEVENIIRKEEKQLMREIMELKGEIAQWAEFEKKKIKTISTQNKEFFPNLQLSNKRQEILMKNFDILTK